MEHFKIIIIIHLGRERYPLDEGIYKGKEALIQGHVKTPEVDEVELCDAGVAL